MLVSSRLVFLLNHRDLAITNQAAGRGFTLDFLGQCVTRAGLRRHAVLVEFSHHIGGLEALTGSVFQRSSTGAGTLDEATKAYQLVAL